LVAILTGFGFYSFRCRKPFWYGVAETLIGVAVLAGVYVLVRGLDNMGRALPRRGLHGGIACSPAAASPDPNKKRPLEDSLCNPDA
jgi:hypothetical protein